MRHFLLKIGRILDILVVNVPEGVEHLGLIELRSSRSLPAYSANIFQL